MKCSLKFLWKENLQWVAHLTYDSIWDTHIPREDLVWGLAPLCTSPSCHSAAGTEQVMAQAPGLVQTRSKTYMELLVPFQLLDPRLLQTFVKWTNEWELWFFCLLKKISLFSCVSVNEIHNQFKFKHFWKYSYKHVKIKCMDITVQGSNGKYWNFLRLHGKWSYCLPAKDNNVQLYVIKSRQGIKKI